MSNYKKNAVGRPRVAAAWSSVRKSTFSVDFDKTPAAHTFIETYGAQAAVSAFDQYLILANHAVCARLIQRAPLAAPTYSPPAIERIAIQPPSPPPVFEQPIIVAPIPVASYSPTPEFQTPVVVKRGSILDDDE